MKPSARSLVLGACIAGLLLAACGGAPAASPQVVGAPKPFATFAPPFPTPPPFPDLSGQLKCPSRASPGEEIGDRVMVRARNSGGRYGRVAQNFFVDLVLSSDTVVPVQFATYSANFIEDGLLAGGREPVARLGPGETLEVLFPSSAAIPADTPAGPYYLGAVIDPGGTFPEFNRANNVLLCPMLICPPRANLLNGLIVGASGGTVGFATLNVAWTYESWGERPERLTITVYRRQQGAWTNIMPSNQPFDVPAPATDNQADVIIYRLFSGDYRLVFDAYYACGEHTQSVFEQAI